MIILLLIPFIPLIALIGWLFGVHKREKWETIPIRRNGWPDDILHHPEHNRDSWTYKRCAGQNLVWALFGNDSEGCTPWFRDEWWGFWRWWFRNSLVPLKKWILGWCWWKEADPYCTWNTEHLEIKVICGEYKEPGFYLHFIKPKKRTWLCWRPFIAYYGWLSIWYGWKRRGQWACSVKTSFGSQTEKG